ncbi:laminin subunit alpha-1 [Anthonomus grandis grandis]|uniref:laminin subunit alpha-1 n=1 Tax=Anthonomus grandis grandis TaxID=2921223 RepID=UPI0021666B3B|nr:laminin subunit alpha-1 [Anthonomus grandis grandis]
MHCGKIFVLVLLVVVNWVGVEGKQHRNKGGGKHNLKFLKNHRGIGNNVRRNANSTTVGLWPSVFNLATKADIVANATCGSDYVQEFCRLAEPERCGICDENSADLGKRHPIINAIDGTNSWWQSPPLSYGKEFEFVSVTVDLKQIYQIAYIKLKSAISPRPAVWVLEKSLDNQRFAPWQFFARNAEECQLEFNMTATKGKPRYFTDTDVICTTFYSKLKPLENGDVFISLIEGRPGESEASPEILEFTKARYVRFNFKGLHGNLDSDRLKNDPLRDKKLFYSIKDIDIGGQCVCNGHAENCRHNVASGHPECECQHHTCGPNCEKCCPLFNQRRWSPGSSRNLQNCIPCNCHGHAKSCYFDEEVDRAGLSLNIIGAYEGGGVCENCTDFTTGINCDKCISGYFRPFGVLPQDPNPCVKCDCSPFGTTEQICVQYGSLAGTCKCKPEYDGPKCDKCAPGFRGYPQCENPCDPKGVKLSLEDNMLDVEQCTCKQNVEGKFCDRCKPGYFGLSYDHPGGCLSCYCSGVTSLCELAIVKPKKINNLQNWRLTDLDVTAFENVTVSYSGIFSTREGSDGVTRYWLAPKEYSGNKLESYGSSFEFTVRWDNFRGDTSGGPTIGPDMILVGQNGLRIGYGDDVYFSGSHDFKIPLNEGSWYVVPKEVHQINTKMNKDEYHGSSINRHQFLSVLADVKYVLLKGTFHTDQNEALLEEPTMSYGSEEFNYDTGSVEKCSCPTGYMGLSCESCSFGYVRIIPDNQIADKNGYCAKCDCNGHSETCKESGECFCEHNTIGEKCERCAAGYYGNPLRGTSDDCRRCACPLENSENNFSPSCQLDFFNLYNEGGYVCTQCPKGYTGDHCEICDDGYFGDPTEIGNSCKLCDCNGGQCDRKTGQCLACKGNTEGWKCEKCKPDHYGDPVNLNCKACECDLIGSESKQCDNVTGQCVCKEKFVGRTCDQCELGYGNVSALCPPCNCNTIGSKSGLCDVHTGICECLPGVDGFRCDACQNLHWGFSADGCQACNCDPNGSKYSSCDPSTGQCICKSHYEGKTCDSCKPGYWKTLKKDCIKCHCNEFGALDSVCDQENGQCKCKPGITGQNCDRCMPNYFGTVDTTCIECEPCTKKGHVCGKGGKCLCPPLTIGKECERCTLNAWDYEPLKGCKACNCSHTGSTSLQCEKFNGFCPCKIGFDGSKCDRCAFGYYGYPNCRKCLCNSVGTLETECQNGLCQCNEDGRCNCKENVRGSKCNMCKVGTFGLSKENPKGCRECFCFNRSDDCEDTNYNWDKIRFEKFENGIENNEAISSDTISLPKQFMGDLTTSYDGYLSVNGTGGRFSVFLTGNGISLQSDVSTHELRFNEKFWTVTSGDLFPTCQHALTKECFLVVLQRVTSVVIQGQGMEIVEVLLDSAKPYIPYNRTSHSIEKCACPNEYTGLSCQNPNTGYYRYFPEESDVTRTSWIDSVIGAARPCDCNGRSSQCHPDTGFCQNCNNNTAGNHCEFCAIGFYQDYVGNCQACLCPSEEDNNAESCVAKKFGFVCHCKKGYTGSKCDSCKESYYRDTKTNKCVPCSCNFYGSYSSVCNANGMCECKPGFHGNKCGECLHPREFIKEGVCTPCDECTQLLFKDLDRLSKALEDIKDIFKDGLSAPWKLLDSLKTRYKWTNKKFDYRFLKTNEILLKGNISGMEDAVLNIVTKVDELNKDIALSIKKAEENINNLSEMQQFIKGIEGNLSSLIQTLRNFGKKHVDVEEAFNKATTLVAEIRETIDPLMQEIQDYQQPILAYCDKIHREVEKICHKSPELPYEDLNDINNKIDELDLLTREAEENSAVAELQNDQNNEAMLRLQNLVKSIEEMVKSLEKSTEKSQKMVEGIKISIDNLETNIEAMEEFDFTIMDDFSERIESYEDERPELEDLVDRALVHADDLKGLVNSRIGLLNFTRDETEKIQTSTAYNEIFEGISEAKDRANKGQEVLKEAINLMYPKDSDRLIDKANLAHSKSDRLAHRITNMRDISNKFNSLQNDLDTFKNNIIDSGRFNNELNRQLLNLEYQLTSKGDMVSKLHEAMNNSSKIVNDMRRIENDVSELNITTRYDLFNEKDGFFNARSEAEQEIFKASESVRAAIRKVSALLESNKEIDDSAIKNGKKNLDRVTFKIGDLQNKILYARQAAESINIPMGLSNCSMLYSIPKTEIFKSLAITFKCTNCQLFKWDRGGINIKIKNGRAILSYSIDDQNDEITTDNEGEVKTEKTLLVQRVGSLLQMRLDEDSSWKSARIGSKVLVVDPSDRFQVGDGLPVQNNAYIFKFTINDNNVGLWKFIQTSGHCKGVKERSDEKIVAGAQPFFSGYGYKKYGTAPLSPIKFAIPFYFSTFDDNSLIYLAHDREHPSAFIALTLEDGHLKFNVRHNNGKTVSLKTNKKFNDGKTYSVDIAMVYLNKMQYYTLETEKSQETTKERLDNNAVFRIKKAVHYVGGVAPTLDTSSLNVTTRSFLGFLRPRAQLSKELISSGVTEKTGELELEKAWFNGNGTLELSTKLVESRTSQKLESIAFILRPMNSNAGLMDIKHFGAITLSDRLIQINLNNGEHYLADKRLAMNLNDYNVVSIMFKSGMISLSVNDEDENLYRTKIGAVYNNGDRLDMTIGSVEGFDSFHGGISDLSLNNGKLPFTSKTVKAFTKVEIGREDPLIRPTTVTLKDLSTVTSDESSMQNTEGCATTANYVTDPTAISFGDQPNSFLKIKTSFWKKDFKLEFEFRTLYEHGTIFVSAGSSAPLQYNLLEIKNGLLIFHVNGKRKKIPKNWPITFTTKVNDGKWHRVKLVKKNNKKLQIWLDGEAKKPVRIPKTNVRAEIFFGGIPRDYVISGDLKEKIRPFRGCLNSLQINEVPQLLGKNTNDIIYSNIRQCFPKIEEGAYFGGDAYAIYKEGFRINKILDLTIQFRTAEQNGILITISNDQNYPALSVELQNGAVVMAVDLGNGMQTNVTNNLDSDFALCDNRWHEVRAMYSSSELTVNVDGIRKSWVQSDVDSLMDAINAPLYIGGLPDNAPAGTLKTRENFKGCIKSVKIENESKDWTEMEELNSVLLSSCPVVPEH